MSSQSTRRIVVRLAIVVAIVLCPGLMAHEELLAAPLRTAETEKSHSEHNSELTVELSTIFGDRGGKRPAVFVIGESIFTQFRIAGLEIDEKNEVRALFRLTLVDSKGREVFDHQAKELKDKGFFGGSDMCGQLILSYPSDIVAPGEHEIRISVVDLASGKEVTSKTPVTFLPRDAFGVANLRFAQDRAGQTPVGAYVGSGDEFFLTGAIVGFGEADGEAAVRIALMTREHGKDKPVLWTSERTLRGPIPENGKMAHFSLRLGAGRPGRYVIELQVEDLNSKQPRQVTYLVPLVVVDPSKITAE